MNIEEIFLNKIWSVINNSRDGEEELLLSMKSQDKIEDILKEYHRNKIKEKFGGHEKSGEYVILDFRDLNNIDYMKNEEGDINYYKTFEEASLTCGMYEFEDAWVCKLMYNHKEDEVWGGDEDDNN